LQDSLWAAEDIEAVFDQDPQRVCILQGPVAVKGSIVKDEPVKQLLGNINRDLIQRILEQKYKGDDRLIPTIDYLSHQPPVVAPQLSGVKRSVDDNVVVYKISKTVPETDIWLATLAGPNLNWLTALIMSPIIVQGSSYIDNPIRRILKPRPGQKVVVTNQGSVPGRVTIYGGARSYGLHKPDFKALEIVFQSSSNSIDITLYEDRQDVTLPLILQFQYQPSSGYAPIHELAAGRNKRIKEFYWKLWYGDDAVLPEIDIRETFVGPVVTIDADDVEQFCAVVGNQTEAFKAVRSETVQAPMDFAIVTGWKVCPIPLIDFCLDINFDFSRPS